MVNLKDFNLSLFESAEPCTNVAILLKITHMIIDPLLSKTTSNQGSQKAQNMATKKSQKWDEAFSTSKSSHM